MVSKRFYLKGNIQAEPLVNNWYAWSMLISPATNAMITTKQHHRILESYTANPEIHASSAQKKSLKGGLFVENANELEPEFIKDFLEQDKQNRAEIVALSQAIDDLQKLIQEEAKGMSLESLYERIPEPLQGMVELNYDLNNYPSFRLIEPLFYMNPKFYDKSLQSINLCHLNSDDRPFILSSPRFEGDNTVNLQIPFDSPLYEKLFASKQHGLSLEEVEEILSHAPNRATKAELFYSFFSEKPSYVTTEANTIQDDTIRVRYFGHATILIESQHCSILSDPIISYDITNGPDRLSYKDLPDVIDYVVLTHNHQDHILFETMLQLRHKVKYWVVPPSASGTLQDPSIKLMLTQLGFKNIIELSEFETVTINSDSRIVGVPFFGEHGDLNIQSKLAYFIEVQGHKLMCTADSRNLSPKLYENVRTYLGPIDTLFIGMECKGAPLSWVYGPLYSGSLRRKMDQDRRLNGSDCDSAWHITQCLEPSAIYIYAMGAEPWLSFVSSIAYTTSSEPIIESDKLIARCEEKQLEARRLYGTEVISLGNSRKK
ncbi:hypothetical protein BET10_15390 [Pseudoalteromonas amylolytica]|uniref:Polyketide synthase n=1 Tax=Pseudoalteromonas amylolytica TaxID=1859457 RepID=A0A1S1MSS7_9GAMM|nr:hypothetical protein BFC16_19585 [Pseudoalteromonas sp. JW3]OHU90183.1 hypothetical protein BET10_15390 [Pseudoalteromonas amylolytica]